MVPTITLHSKIAIIGAGIGGMALAVALAKAGARDIRIYERRSNLQEPGAGMQLGPNACRILDQLGFSEKLKKISERFPSGQLFEGVNGRKLTGLPLDDHAWRAYGAHNCQLLRKDLHQMLWDGLKEAFPSGPVQMNKELVGLSDIDEAPRMAFADGTEETADIVICADGVRSKARSLLFDDAEASYSGYFAWRGLVNVADLPASGTINTLQVWIGENKHLIAYPLAGGKLINLVGLCESDSWQSESVCLETDPSAWLENYQGWDSSALSLIGGLETCSKWALHELPPLPSWHKGGVGLLGDAAHPMMPSLAQGAAQAFEDAICLTELISEGGHSADELLGLYFDARAARARRVQEASRWNLEFFHRRKTVFSQLQNLGMRLGGPLTAKIVAGRYHWLYS